MIGVVDGVVLLWVMGCWVLGVGIGVVLKGIRYGER